MRKEARASWCLDYLLQGILRGYDQATNLILDECFERVYSTKVRRHCLCARQHESRRALRLLLCLFFTTFCPEDQLRAAGLGRGACNHACRRALPRPTPRSAACPQSGVEQLVLGLYVVRGDNMWVQRPPACPPGRPCCPPGGGASGTQVQGVEAGLPALCLAAAALASPLQDSAMG